MHRCIAILALLVAVVPAATIAASEQHDVVLSTDGTITIDGADTVHVRPGADLDSLIWVALDEPGKPIEQFTATLHLPTPVSGAQVPAHRLLGIKGVGSMSSQLIDAQTIFYQAESIQPTAVVSVVADFPKGYLQLPLLEEAGVAVQSYNTLWQWSSLVLPLLGLLLLAVMGVQRLIDRQVPAGSAPRTDPPNAVSPALISILYENKIQPEAIAGTIIDLAHRGYISIYNKANNFIIAMERDIDLGSPAFRVGDHDVVLSDEELVTATREGLRPFEKILLSKLFVAARPISSKEDVKVRIGHGLFSKKVAAIYEQLFVDASRVHYFVPNAVRVHRRYLLIGWILFFIGAIGFAAGVLTLPDPKYFLLFWVGLIGMAYLIVRLAPYVPLRTSAGRRELGQFLAYRQFLSEPNPLPDGAGIDQFMAALPAAWALRAHHEWAKRCSKAVFHRPPWYFTTKTLTSTTDFTEDLDHLVSFVAESFSSVREKSLV